MGELRPFPFARQSFHILLFPKQPPLTQCATSFVSRANPKDPNRHVILGAVGYDPRKFAEQMNLSLPNGWAIVRAIADMCLRKPEGKYVLVKDPNKPVLRLYAVPPGTFEDVEEDGAGGAGGPGGAPGTVAEEDEGEE